MATERRPSPTNVEQLVRDLDAGFYDDQLPPVPVEGQEAAPQRFADLRPFDVRAWAARKGIKLPDRS